MHSNRTSSTLDEVSAVFERSGSTDTLSRNRSTVFERLSRAAAAAEAASASGRGLAVTPCTSWLSVMPYFSTTACALVRVSISSISVSILRLTGSGYGVSR